MRSVLVTGGAGFIGRHVCRELKAQGFEPVAYDLQPPPTGDGVGFVQGDVLDAAVLAKACAAADGVVHLASLISVAATERRRRETLDVAVLGTRNVCLAVVPTQRVVFASTSEVYGDARVVPTPESCPPSPKSVYATAKLAAEEYVRTLTGPAGPHFTILRLFSVYGPGQGPAFVVPRFAQQALRGEPLTLYGGGAQVRAFVHAADVARGVVLALTRREAAGGTYNIGNPTEPITMRELAAKIVKLTESPSQVLTVPFEASDRTAEREIHRRSPDITAASRTLGYRPTIHLEEGLRDVIASLR